uniref:Uncharacterized protein n=1 Tax=Peromyscus maniculatus bairdii TaxID=230844 RepID=A0A8C8USB5_PERMB
MVGDMQPRNRGCWDLQGGKGTPELTSKWATVKMTGSMRKTRLDSLLMDAAMTCEFTTREAPPGPPVPASPASFTVAFSVDKNRPKLL